MEGGQPTPMRYDGVVVAAAFAVVVDGVVGGVSVDDVDVVALMLLLMMVLSMMVLCGVDENCCLVLIVCVWCWLVLCVADVVVVWRWSPTRVCTVLCVWCCVALFVGVGRCV